MIAALCLPDDRTAAAERLLRADAARVASAPWRSELRNVLATRVRTGRLDEALAYAVQSEAEALMAGREHEPNSLSVLQLAARSGRSA